MAAMKLTEVQHEWDNGFQVLSDADNTVMALVVGGSVDDYFIINVPAWHPENVPQMWLRARRVFKRAIYIDTKYASGIVVDFTSDFSNSASHPIRCLYLSKNPKARHLRRRTSDDVATLVSEIEDFSW